MDDSLDILEQQDKMALEIEKRAEETEAKVIRILNRLVRKPIETLNLEEKRFLKARASYLSKADREAYAEVINMDLSNEAIDAPKEKELIEYTRKELDQKALDLGVENPQDLPNKQAVIDEIRKNQ